MSAGYVPVKTGFRGKTINIAADKISLATSNAKVRRFCIGGRGREWGHECFRVIEEMSRRKDAQVFMQPVDAVQHPEYYSLVKEPIDLSKIQLKFHGGSYASMFTFIDDVQLMFKNHLLLYSDQSDPIHQDIIQEQLWFNEEMEKIKKKWLLLGVPSAPSKGVVRTLLPKEIRDRIDAIEAENRTIVGSPLIMTSPPATFSTPSTKSTKSSFIAGGSVGNSRPISAAGMKSAPLVLRKLPLSKISGEKTSSDMRPLYAIHLPKDPSNQKIVISSQGNSSLSSSSASDRPAANSLKSKPIILIPASSASLGASQKNVVLLQRRASDRNGRDAEEEEEARNGATHEPLTLVDENSEDQSLLVINASNMWFGGSQISSTRPVIVSEEGILITCCISSFLKKKSRGGKQPDDLFQFLIRPNDLVKCYAHVGNSRKHTIFLVVLPNCIRRLESVLLERLAKRSPPSSDGALSSSFFDACLITIFTPSLSKIQISQLMYSMWSLGKSSMFGSNLYSEIDQNAALGLLGNVKPSLLNSRRFEGFSGGAAPSRRSRPADAGESDGPDAGGSDGPDDDPAMDCSVVLEKIDLEKILEGKRCSASLDSRRVSANGNFEIEEISLNDIHLKDEPQNDGFQTEIVELDEGDDKGNVFLVLSDSLRSSVGEDSPGERNTKRPAILSGRKRKRKSPHKELQTRRVKRSDDNFADSDSDSSTQDRVVGRARRLETIERDEETGDEFSEDDIKDLEIVLPNDSDREAEFLEATDNKSSDQSEEKELILTGKKIAVRCPITQRIMGDPVRNSFCGHSYDKVGVEQLIRNRGNRARCPVPGCQNVRRLELNQLVPNDAIKRILEK